MTFVNAFEKIREKLAGKEPKNATENFAVQISLTNKDCGGVFYVQQKDGRLYVEPYDYIDNDADIRLTYITFCKLIDGRITIDEALKKNLMTIDGDSKKLDNICGIISKS